jgi:hypothetical protein
MKNYCYEKGVSHPRETPFLFFNLNFKEVLLMFYSTADSLGRLEQGEEEVSPRAVANIAIVPLNDFI